MAEEKEDFRDVTPDENSVIFDGPSIFVNRMFVSATGTFVRLTFAENDHEEKPIFRTAVSMTVGDLLRLGRLIDQVATRTKKVEAKDG